MQVAIADLEQIGILRDLDQAQLKRLCDHSQIRSYRPQEIVFHEQDTLAPCLYILVSGLLHVTKLATTGKKTLLRTLRVEEIFAAPALVGNCIAPATIHAETNSKVLMIERLAFMEVIRQTPEVALMILAIYNQRLQEMHTLVHELTCERAVVRLIRLIQQQAVQYGTKQNEQGHSFLNEQLPYAQMACRVGITYEECIRLIRGLKPIITYQKGGKICITDWQALESICQ